LIFVRIESCLKVHHQLQKNIPNLKNIKEKLTLREQQTLNLYLEGYSRKEIALSLQVSDNTVKYYINNIFQKNNIKSRAELLKKIKLS
jgi:DNA-binding NarL/FixJ family response regulator